MLPRCLLPVLLTALVACGAPPAPSPPPVALLPTASAPVEPPFVPPPAPALRLPPLARPVRQDLELWLDPHAATFRGRVGIDLEILEPTRVLWVNATDLAVDQVHVDDGKATRIGRVTPGGADFVGFVFERALLPGNARLTVDYRGSIDAQRSRGIYVSQEGDGEPYLYTFFEPVDARRAMPCFDEPSYKIPWKVTLHVPKGDVALANAPVASDSDEAATQPPGHVVAMQESRPMPSYLVAFVVGPFDVVDAGNAGHAATPLRFVVPRGRGAETAYAASVTPRIVGLLEDYFGMPYPYGKLDVAVVPRYWGTMEHPGLVALGQPLTLIAKGEDSLPREQDYANIATHELAHYWFGDYVTTAWWDDTWLNESLGTWMDEKITAQLEPRWGFDRERVDRAWSGMQADALPSAKAVRQRVESAGAIESSFDNEITYFKGQAVAGMFEAWMTPERFQRAVRAYMTSRAWKSATSDDFLAALDAEQPGAGAAMRTFVDQPGVPSVSFHVSCRGDARSIDVAQRRYQPAAGTLPPETWRLPVCVRYAGTDRACALLDGPTGSLPVTGGACPAWVVGNADGAGYYHVAYTGAQLRAALSPQARATATERIALLHDADALVQSGELLLGEALALVADTVDSRERQVVEAGLQLLKLAPDAALDDAEAAQVARWLRAMYGVRQARLGVAHRPDDGADELLLRPRLFSLLAGPGQDVALRRRARSLALAWLKDPKAVEPELVDGVLAAAGKANDAELFEALMARIHAEKDHRKVKQLASALGAFTAPALVTRAQQLVSGPELDVRDVLGVLWAEREDRATRELLWTFLQASFDAVSARMRPDDVIYKLMELPRDECDDAHRQQVEAFFASRAARFDGGVHTAEKVAASIGQCAATFQRSRASLDAFLRRRGQ